jgi:hypothetical protein
MIRMPWTDATAPNLTIEITDECNISCRACYKRKGSGFRSLSEIDRDLDAAVKLRPLHTITISGGEPTLHPDLYRIIKMVKARGRHVFLLTNGLLTDEKLLEQLRHAGLDSILFHVDTGQSRADLPWRPTFADVRKRLVELAQKAARTGLDVSIAMTLYEDVDEVLPACSQLFFDSPDLTFLFLARGVDPRGLYAPNGPEAPTATGLPSSLEQVKTFYRQDYAIEPYAYVPANTARQTVWISYFVPIIYNGPRKTIVRIRSNILDTWLMWIPRLLSGRFVHKTRQQPGLTLLRTLMNCLSTFRLGTLAALLWRLCSRNALLRHKMIVYDDGPSLTASGRMVRCQYCPTAIVREGKSVACCEADFGLPGGECP